MSTSSLSDHDHILTDATPAQASDVLQTATSPSAYTSASASGSKTARRQTTPELEDDDGLSSAPDLDSTQEDEEEDEREIPVSHRVLPQPSAFYPNEHTMNSARREELERLASGSGGILRPEDDPFCTRGIPIFTPSMEDFRDFEAYMEAILPWGQRSGIVKVIPPQEWTRNLPEIPKEKIASLRIKNPIQQNMQGISGLYRQNTIEKRKTLSVKDWFEKCNTAPFKGPGPKDAGRTGADDRATPVAAPRRRSGRRPGKLDLVGDSKDRGVESPAPLTANSSTGTEMGEVKAEQSERSAQQDGRGKPVLVLDADLGEMDTDSSTLGESSIPGENLKAGPDVEDDTIDRKAIPEEEIDPFYEAFEAHKSWLPDNTDHRDYSVEACRELERKFWRGLSLGEPSWYGADLKGSLFTEETTSWNVAKLPNLLNRLKLKTKLPGVNTTYLYFGMWAAAFAWHVEDCDLWSINYIHFGAPKQWYSIPPAQAESFERKMAGYFSQDARQCKQFLRHKSFTVSPAVLAKDGCRPNVLVQQQGEFVITYPRGYHSGYNLGFNCAESINFALDSWIELGRRAQFCTCVDDSVRIDVDAVLAESALLEAIELERVERKRQVEAKRLDRAGSSKRRVRGSEDSSMPRKRRKIDIAADPVAAAEAQDKARKHAESSRRRTCMFCPDTTNFPTLPVFSSPEKESRGTPPLRGHIACARSIPELWIEETQSEGSSKLLVIMGSDNIPRDRWNLKCSVCQDKKAREMGAKIQCTNGQCKTAFHVTCAMLHELTAFKEFEMEQWMLKTDGNGETDQPGYELVRYVKPELLCARHNPTAQHLRKKQENTLRKNRIRHLPIGHPVELRWAQGYRLESLFLGVVEGLDDVVQVLGEDGLPLEVPINRVFAIATDDDLKDNAAVQGSDEVSDRLEMFVQNPVDMDKVVLTSKLVEMLSENPILRGMLTDLGYA